MWYYRPKEMSIIITAFQQRDNDTMISHDFARKQSRPVLHAFILSSISTKVLNMLKHLENSGSGQEVGWLYT